MKGLKEGAPVLCMLLCSTLVIMCGGFGLGLELCDVFILVLPNNTRKGTTGRGCR